MKTQYEKMKESVAALSNAEKDKDSYYEIYREAFEELKQTLVCPACGKVGKVDHSCGCSYHELECSSCNFNPGRAKTLAEVAQRWEKISDALTSQEVKE